MPSLWSAAIPEGEAEKVGFSFRSVTVTSTVNSTRSRHRRNRSL